MKNLSLPCVGICIFLCPLFYGSCNEDEDELPPITMEGKNTFGCFVNGKLFITKAPIGQSGLHAEISTYPDTVGVIIYASNSSVNKVLVISIYDSPTLQTGKSYDLTNPNFQVQYTDYANTNSCTYESVQNGFITLSKFDLSKSIVSGTFQFDIFGSNCKDSISITQGRFDTSELIR